MPPARIELAHAV